MTDQEIADKISDVHLRMRRIETRLTKYIEAQGFDTGCQRSRMVVDGVVEVPSPACSLKEIIGLVPASWTGPVSIVHQGKTLCTLAIAQH